MMVGWCPQATTKATEPPPRPTGYGRHSPAAPGERRTRDGDDEDSSERAGDDVELIILAVPLVLLWLMVSRGRKQQRELMAQQDSVTPGTEVMTTSGMYAEVIEVEGEVVVLEIAPGVRTRWTKRAIGQVVSTPAGPEGTVETADSTETTGDREDVRSEAGYATPPNADADGTGTEGRQ